MPIYQRDDNSPRDSDFEPGEQVHLVVGNGGRLLDPRRTPVRIVDLRLSAGAFTVRLEAFEDEGELWEVPLEDVSRYQFARGQERAGSATLSEIQSAIERFDRPLRIRAAEEDGLRTAKSLEALSTEASDWLRRESRFLQAAGRLPDPETREGVPTLWADLRAYLSARNLWGIEDAFARRFVSNPNSGELVKGHRIVLAELGLVPFEGKIVRDRELFSGEWSRERRADHILSRMAFVRSLFKSLGLARVSLYRGMSCAGPLRPPENGTFVSASFSRAIAAAHFDSGDESSTGALHRQAIPIDRLFMTYYETEPMNRHYREAEAVLLHDADNLMF